MLTNHYFVSRRVGVMGRQIDQLFFLFFGPAAAAVQDLKGSALSFKTAPRPSYLKGCTQEYTNKAFYIKLIEIMINKISQSIEQDCERLQCLKIRILMLRASSLANARPNLKKIRSGNHTFIFLYLRHGLQMPRPMCLYVAHS